MVLVVAVALIDREQRVLLAQRPLDKAMAGLWEFPGGQAGQTAQPPHWRTGGGGWCRGCVVG